MFKINWHIARKKGYFLLLIDFFMLSMAITNLILFTFDYTYFKFRNFYYHSIPIVLKYDVIKGIEPHTRTVIYLETADKFFAAVKNNQVDKPLIQDEMIKLSNQLIDEPPFDRSHKAGEFEIIKERMRQEIKVSSARQAFILFWSSVNNENIKERENFFNNKIKKVIETNFWRRIDYSGSYIDYFFYIDMFFVVIFLIEFLLMWSYTIKRKGSEERILYPIYHIHDLLGCIPLAIFRIFRLFRVVSIFIRLVDEGVISRDSFVYKTIADRVNKIKAVLNADTSNRVSIDILTDIQQDIKDGSNRDLIEQVLKIHKSRIQKTIVENIKKIEVKIVDENRRTIADFLSRIAEDVIYDLPQYKTLIRIPYVKDKVQEMLSTESINKFLDHSTVSFANSLRENLNSRLGNYLLNNITEDIIDELINILDDPETQLLIKDINENIVEHLIVGIEEKRLKLKVKHIIEGKAVL